MNADGLIDRILVETTGDREAALRLTTEMLLALFSDWYERQDFYTAIAAQHPHTTELWVILQPDLEASISYLRTVGYRDEAPLDQSSPVDQILDQYPDALDPLLDHYTCPLTPEEAGAIDRVLWGDSDAHH